jgi:hypothetical protein
MLRIMVDVIYRSCPAPIVIQWLARVRVHVKAREVAAGNIQSNAVALLKNN